MGFILNLTSSFLFLWCLIASHYLQVQAQPNIFNLLKYGGSASKNFDNSKALLSAWRDACKWQSNTKARVVIPGGTYLLNPVELIGPCKGPIEFTNMGTLVSPPGLTNVDYWIRFRIVDGLSINGGTFEGQGSTAWDHFSQLPPTYSMMSLSSVKNTIIRKVRLNNSKKAHVVMFGSSNVEISGMTISTPETSHNTDGIKIGNSNGVKIHDTKISSGDDCVAILTGTHNVNVTRVFCGPGHGISIGSMGKNPGDEISQIRVTNCTLHKTMNGVRIKSWANLNRGVCSHIAFKDIIMEDTLNPIIIDQDYCPNMKCAKGESHVHIQGVSFINIKGTSASKAAIKMDCSSSNPCDNIKLINIDLRYNGPGGEATAECNNVRGSAGGMQTPGPCIRN